MKVQLKQSLETKRPFLQKRLMYLDIESYANVWQMLADLDKKKQGPAVYLAMTGRARDVVSKTPAEELGDNELDRIFRSWTPYFLKMEVQEHTFHLKNCHFKRSSGEHLQILLLNSKNGIKFVKIIWHLTEAAKASFLLSAANMSEENEKLARTLCKVLD